MGRVRHGRINAAGVWLCCGLAFGLGFVMPPAAFAFGQVQMARPVVTFSCVGDDPVLGQWCRGLVRVFRAAAPPQSIVRFGEDLAPMANSIALVLRIERMDQHVISGHLEWRTAAGQTAQSGPQVSFDVQDSGVTESLFRRYVKSLLNLSQVPFPIPSLN